MMIYIKKWFILLFLLGLIGCVPNVATTPPMPLPTFQPRPDFVLEVVPRESQVLSMSVFEAKPEDEIDEVLLTMLENISAYNSLVCLKVETGLLAQIGDDFTLSSTVVDRVIMHIDDLEVKNVYAGDISLEAIRVVDANGQALMRGLGTKVICGQVDLEVGIHKVWFQFRQTSGNVLEYQWSFAIIDG